jgi:CIC family chloride channel protein
MTDHTGKPEIQSQRSPSVTPFSGTSVSAGLRARILAAPVTLRAWIRRLLPNEAQHLFGLTLVVGVVCGFAAVAFHLTIRAAETWMIDRAITAPGSSWMLWTILTPTLAGLLAGACLTWIVPGARGSGIPQVKVAYATEGGRVKLRDTVGKFFIGALQIGSGASLGREGPTVQVCAGATSLLARLTALPPRSMRRLTPVGVAAGIAAAFNAPIAAVTFTIEEIMGALDQTVLSGVVVAAALAAMIERSVLGVHPVFEVEQSYGLAHASGLLSYALLGVAAAATSIAFTDGLLKLRASFRDLHIVPTWMHPAVGGLVTGGLAVIVLRTLHVTGVTGGGYETLGLALAGQLGYRALMVLCVAKLIATVFSYSSGGAGGIFAPALFVGAMLGGVFGHVDNLLFGPGHEQLGAFALVGMGAVFAGVIRAPITSVLIIFEMTGGYGLVLPLMLANMTSYALARHFRPEPVYEALLLQDGIHLPTIHPRTQTHDGPTVADAMTSDVQYLSTRQTLSEAAHAIANRTFALAPVTDDDGSIVGSVSLSALRRIAAESPEHDITQLIQPLHSISSGAPVMEAAARMIELGVRQLAVIDDDEDPVGIVAMSDLVRTHTASSSSSNRSRATSLPQSDIKLVTVSSSRSAS